jgi:hypothetical protein
MTDADKAVLRDVVDDFMLRATQEQKCGALYQAILRERMSEEMAICGANTEQPAEPNPSDTDPAAAEPTEPRDHSPKPANFIPRDGLLARCVRMLAAEGHSQARIARELRLNKRTVTRLLQQGV